ncbi:MAG: NAD(P)H-dependent oxidoreductase, partial [Anaerolineaceae bacterium]|nr:NAD(P)H-dependent oxidoreductase [Anaerolineaceae bacterium]
LKNALDWASTDTLGNVLMGKPTAIMGASRSIFGTARGQLQLRQVLLAANADVMRRPELYVRRMQNLLDEKNDLVDEQTIQRIRLLIAAFIEHIKRVK